jgi:hypothetical protein
MGDTKYGEIGTFVIETEGTQAHIAFFPVFLCLEIFITIN